MKKDLNEFYEKLENFFHKLHNGKWIKNELGKLADVSATIITSIISVLNNKTVDAAASILVPKLYEEIPEIEAVLLKALTLIMAAKNKNNKEVSATLKAFVIWLQSQPKIMQDAILRKLAAVILSLLTENTNKTQTLSIADVQPLADAMLYKHDLYI